MPYGTDLFAPYGNINKIDVAGSSYCSWLIKINFIKVASHMKSIEDLKKIKEKVRPNIEIRLKHANQNAKRQNIKSK